MAPDGVILADREGESFMVGSSRAWIKAGGKDTTDTYSVVEFALAPDSSASIPHRHPDWDEAFYVLEGEVETLVGDQAVRCWAGSFILIPRNVAHRVSNVGADPARILAIAQPWADEYVREVAQAFPASGPPDRAKLLETYKKYGVEQVAES